ncbi:MAG TPA: nuclear transport factor 2 family protein [Nitrobacter sp.]|nr:nuclear transport factor 2 family protein [Nitrobacter sp.]
MKPTTTLRNLAICGAAIMMFAAPALAADDPRVAAEIMALARSQWAADIAGQPAQRMMETVADDYTEFNGDYPTRIDGKAMNLAMAAITPSTKSLYGDMQNAKVQVYGDTAILTYNYAGISRTADGKTEPSVAKSTRVYVRQGGRWMLVHANFAPVPGAGN